MHDEKFPEFFCKEYSVWICHDKTVEFCPCRLKLNSIDFCNFPQYIVELAQDKGSPKFKEFVSLICKELKHRVQGTDKRSLDIQHRLMEAVKDMEMGEIKPGDIVYCTNVGKEVIFYEYPERKDFDIYYEHGVFPGDAKYKTFEGEIGTAPVACFIKLAEGKYHIDYELKGKSAFMKVDYIISLGRNEGFRIEKQSISNGYKLRFYGDSKQKLDDFITYCCQNDFYL